MALAARGSQVALLPILIATRARSGVGADWLQFADLLGGVFSRGPCARISPAVRRNDRMSASVPCPSASGAIPSTRIPLRRLPNVVTIWHQIGWWPSARFFLHSAYKTLQARPQASSASERYRKSHGLSSFRRVLSTGWPLVGTSRGCAGTSPRT